jgi:hypothetical protein
VQQLEDTVAEAAGVPTAVAGVDRYVRSKAGRAATWPPLALLAGRRPAVPEVTGVQRAVVDTEVRSLADEATDGLATPWATAVTRAATARLTELGDRLDKELPATALDVDRMPAWVSLLRLLQWVLLVAAVVAGAWWAGVAFDLVDSSGTLGSPPDVAGFTLPAVVLVGALVAGLLLALVARFLVAGLARSRAEAAEQRLRGAVDGAIQAEVLGPLGSELAAYTAYRTGIGAALR